MKKETLKYENIFDSHCEGVQMIQMSTPTKARDVMIKTVRIPISSFQVRTTSEELSAIAKSLTEIERDISRRLGTGNGNFPVEYLLKDKPESEAQKIKTALEGLEARGLIIWDKNDPQWIIHTLKGMDVYLVLRGHRPSFTIDPE